jgi:putative transposase
VRQRWPVDLWGWVVMPDHVHLLIAPRQAGVAVGRFAGEVKEQTSRSAITWLEAYAPKWLSRISVREGRRTRRRFWQPGGGYDRNIDQIDTLYASLTYIHMNPVRRGLVSRPEDWQWSSAAWYVGMRPALVELDATLPSP